MAWIQNTGFQLYLGARSAKFARNVSVKVWLRLEWGDEKGLEWKVLSLYHADSIQVKKGSWEKVELAWLGELTYWFLWLWWDHSRQGEI